MAQSDKIGAIANGTGLQVRTGINEVGEALATLNSGATAPLNPVERMLWDQTSAGILRQRNAANTGWEIVLNYGATTAPTAGSRQK